MAIDNMVAASGRMRGEAATVNVADLIAAIAAQVAAALPAGDNNIGNVDLASAIPAGENKIGSVDIAPNSGKATATITRPANTTAYDAKDVIGTLPVAAAGVLTFDGAVVDGETVSIGDDVYEFDTDSSVGEGHIAVDVSGGATASAAVTALTAAITASDTQGVGGVDGAGDTVALTADTAGAAGNAITTTTTCANATFAAGTLLGGLDATYLTFDTGLAAGSGFLITGATVEIDAAAVPAGMSTFKLHLYDAAPTAIADNAAFDLPEADRAKYLGYITLAAPIDLGATLWSQNDNLNFNGKLSSAGTTLYGIMTTDGAYTPTSECVKKITLYVVGV